VEAELGRINPRTASAESGGRPPETWLLKLEGQHREGFMRSMRLVLFAMLLAVPFAMKANAQVSVGIGVGPAIVGEPVGYGPPVCEWGYYGYYPYECAPYGYYGPQWFMGGLFIGSGPWYHNGWYGGGWGRGYGYRGGYGNRGGYGYRGGWGGGHPGGGYRGGYANPGRGFNGGSYGGGGHVGGYGGGGHGGGYGGGGHPSGGFSGGHGGGGGFGGGHGGGGGSHGGGGHR
jgi:hypothetical protein